MSYRIRLPQSLPMTDVAGRQARPATRSLDDFRFHAGPVGRRHVHSLSGPSDGEAGRRVISAPSRAPERACGANRDGFTGEAPSSRRAATVRLSTTTARSPRPSSVPVRRGDPCPPNAGRVIAHCGAKKLQIRHGYRRPQETRPQREGGTSNLARFLTQAPCGPGSRASAAQCAALEG